MPLSRYIAYFSLAFLIIAVTFSLLFYDLYRVSSGSMANTMLQGDIIVSKRSPSIINRGQVALFNLPNGDNDTYVKRCVALAGDTFEIRNATIYVNGVKQKQPKYAITYNAIHSTNPAKTLEVVTQLNIMVDEHDSTATKLWLTQEQVEHLRSMPFITDIHPAPRNPNGSNSLFYENRTPLFVPDSLSGWSLTNYGPMVIPHKGMIINRDNMLFNTYKFLASENIMQSQADSASYIINEDCYFMLGDNRDFSVDSRHFGFIPQSCVTGVAVSVIVLKGQKGTRWYKIFKDFE